MQSVYRIPACPQTQFVRFRADPSIPPNLFASGLTPRYPDSFVVDIPNRTAVCPHGKTSCECDRIAESGRQAVYYYFAWSKSDCCGCPLADQCLAKRKPDQRRTLQVGEKHMIVQQRRQLCRSPEYQRRMQRRNGIEGTQSECVRGYGARRCRYRGLARTSLQMQFIGAA